MVMAGNRGAARREQAECPQEVHPTSDRQMGRVVMFARFAAQASEPMVFAEEESARLRHPWLGTEHLLLGLLRQPDTTVTAVLERLGVTRPAVERELIRTLAQPVDEHVLTDEDQQALRTIGIDLHEVRARV